MLGFVTKFSKAEAEALKKKAHEDGERKRQQKLIQQEEKKLAQKEEEHPIYELFENKYALFCFRVLKFYMRRPLRAAAARLA